MLSLFKLLFSASYWRTLVHPETWRRSRVSVRRLHKDARARKQLRGMLLLIFTPVLCILWLLWAVGMGIYGIVGATVGLLIAFAISSYRKRRRTKQTTPPAVVEPTAEPEPEFHDTPNLRREFADRALLLAVLADRAGSERFLQTKVLPEGHEVITRRRHIDLLREHEIYDRLGPTERDLLLLPDGHWPASTIDNVALSLEPLRLLRWVLRVDSFLPTVGASLTADFRLASSLIADPAPLFAATQIVTLPDLKTGLLAADHYFYRCYAEGIRRGLYVADEPAEHERALNYASRLTGREDQDFLLETTIVSKAEDQTVRLAATLSLRRLQVLGWIKARALNQLPPLDQLEGFQIAGVPKYE
ncbi:MAG: hypothetical protein V4555_06650 [Acidobacteriota bacterium]